MQKYILYYIVPVLLLIVLLLVFAKVYKDGARFKVALYVTGGFLLGWISAFASLASFGLYK